MENMEEWSEGEEGGDEDGGCVIALDGSPMLMREGDSRAELSGGNVGGSGAAGAAGGPLVVPGFMSGCINVRNFRDSCGTLLSALRAELSDSMMEVDFIDVGVSDLKVMTDAMLVEKALAEVLECEEALVAVGDEAMKNGMWNLDKAAESQEEHHQRTMTFGAWAAEQGEVEQQKELVAQDMEGPGFSCSVPPKKGKKRGRPFDRDTRAPLLMNDTDIRRKETLARLKRERDVARESVSLHSLRAKQEREALYTKIQTPLRTLKFLNSALKTPKLASKDQFEPMKENEILLTVEIYDNVKRHLKTQEFVVIGSQRLTALKDRIYCITDTVADKAHVHMPSSYFLIEDTFYNDMRDPKAIDYSLPIRKWVQDQTEVMNKWKALGGVDMKKRRWFGLLSYPRTNKPPSFSAENMNDVYFEDLECRIGAQFLYCHQGNCKHTIIIRDMRLVHPEDIQNAAAYPVLRYVHKLRHRKCSICCIYQARKFTVGDKLAPESPCFFCLNCYYLLHYSRDGTLLYSDYQVHDYFHE